jgi:hypothetical protein
MQVGAPTPPHVLLAYWAYWGNCPRSRPTNSNSSCQNRVSTVNQADALMSESVSRGSCWRAPVREREPIVTEREPEAPLIVTEREPKPGAVGEPGGLCLRAATCRHRDCSQAAPGVAPSSRFLAAYGPEAGLLWCRDIAWHVPRYQRATGLPSCRSVSTSTGECSNRDPDGPWDFSDG